MTTRLWPLAFLVLAAAAVAWDIATVVSRPSVIDGIPLGDRVACDDRACLQFVDFATGWLDEREPTHPAIREIAVHRTNYRDAQGNVLLTIRSGGGDRIVALHLVDGTSRAVHVGCGIGIATDLCFASSGPPDWTGSEPVSVTPRP